MKILFALCEGPHDAQFLGRVMQESGKYKIYNNKLKDYPDPLGDFFIGKFNSRTVHELRIGKPDFPLVPICAYEHKDNGNLVLPISIGGMDQDRLTIKLLTEIEGSFSEDILDVEGSDITAFSILFLFDADSRGVRNTVDHFVERFSGHYETISNQAGLDWIRLKGYPLSIFIFTDKSGETGVLEDVILDLFRINNHVHVQDTERHFKNYFEEISPNSDAIAHEAKRKKGILTTCGQMKKNNAGSALTVVIRDTDFLRGAFDFDSKTSQWYHLLDRINKAFD